MTPFIEAAMRERPTGLSLHYPLLHAAVVGLGARRTLEFGAGASTRVFLEALPHNGQHVSISTEQRHDIATRHMDGMGGSDTASELRESYGHATGRERAFIWDRWTHHCGKSDTFRDLVGVGPLDLILHDGSHAADVVAADLAWAWPLLKRYGLGAWPRPRRSRGATTA